MAKLEDFITRGKRGKQLTKAFYDLSVTEKFEVITEYQERTNRLMSEYDPKNPHYAPDHDLYEKCIKAVLQHSPAESKENFPVPGVANHTTSRAAKLKDNLQKASHEHQVLSALLEIMDAVEECLAQQDIERNGN